MSLADDVRANLAAAERRAILRLLTAVGAYEANDSTLLAAMTSLGHRVGVDRVRAHFDFLAEGGLLVTRTVEGGAKVATLTDRGLDVAEGRAEAAGVEPPRPSQL